jgi:CHAD domain-containing protein
MHPCGGGQGPSSNLDLSDDAEAGLEERLESRAAGEALRTVNDESEQPISPAGWTARLEREIERTRTAAEPEGVHQLRVAAGRLSVFLELSGRRALRDDLRTLRRHATRLRDLDVMSEKERWRDVIDVPRAHELAQLLEALATSRIAGLLHGLHCVPDLAPARARVALARFEKRARRAAQQLEREPADDAALHRLRRRLRRWRYALEWLGSKSKQLVTLQDALGALQDLSIEATRARALPDEERRERYLTEIAAESRAARARFDELWQEHGHLRHVHTSEAAP